MKYLFLVQGEGRGHMTQAISLRNLLLTNGHEVVAVLVGKSERREIPAFFHEKIGVPVETYPSPNFVTDKDNKRVKLFATIGYNLRQRKTYFNSLRFIRDRIKETRPDMVINFYELMGGLAKMRYKIDVPFVSIGHQFLLLHPDFVSLPGRWLDKWSLNFNTWLTGYGSSKFLALSFVMMLDWTKKNIHVVPPLLRAEVLQLVPGNEDYILGYMLNSGYADEITRWHRSRPEVKAHFFWDKKDAPEDLEVEPNLWFHRISDVKFLQYMKNCSGFASTAGFESICEAMYLKKPILMVPTGGHFEQECNALDASRAGAGIVDKEFNLDKLLAYIPQHQANGSHFGNWVDMADMVFLYHLTNGQE